MRCRWADVTVGLLLIKRSAVRFDVMLNPNQPANAIFSLTNLGACKRCCMLFFKAKSTESRASCSYTFILPRQQTSPACALQSQRTRT